MYSVILLLYINGFSPKTKVPIWNNCNLSSPKDNSPISAESGKENLNWKIDQNVDK